MNFVDKFSLEYPVRLLCKVANVSVSGYYAWKTRDPNRPLANVDLLEAVKRLHAASKGTYGRPRLLRALWAEGKSCSSERLRRLMVKHGIASKHRRKYRSTTN